jgi:cytochrome b
MKELCGTVGFVVAAFALFRLTYGAWPPTTGDFGPWLASDGRAMLAMLAGIAGGFAGLVIGRAIGRTLSRER